MKILFYNWANFDGNNIGGGVGVYQKYSDDAKQLKNTYFLGRLGDYKYYDMDKAVNRDLEVFEELRNAA